MHPRTTAAARWGAVYTSVAAASAAAETEAEAVAVAAAVVATDGASLEALDRTRVLALVLVVVVVVAADRLGHWFSWLCGDGCCWCCEEGLGSWLVPGPYVCRSAVGRVKTRGL